MIIHRLCQTQRLRVSQEEAWDFLSTPQNLNEITPESMHFKIVSGADAGMFEGQIISYRVRLAPSIWSNWVSEIKSVIPGKCFVDEQRSGPYRFWHHRHSIRAIDGGVEMFDEVNYAIGFWFAGEIAHRVFVKRQLGSIFAYRQKALANRFGEI